MEQEVKPSIALDAHWLYVEAFYKLQMVRKEAFFVPDLNKVASVIQKNLPFKVGQRDYDTLLENGEVRVLYDELFYIKLNLKGLKYKDALREK